MDFHLIMRELDAAYDAAWRAMQHNQPRAAYAAARPFLHRLAAALSAPADDDDYAELIVTLADLAYISGAATADASLLGDAVRAYDLHLARQPTSLPALRMRAEALLRLRRYAEAWRAFDALHLAACALPAPDDAEVAPFQLRLDAECLDDAVRLGANPAEASTAEGWRELADELEASSRGDARARTQLGALSRTQRALLLRSGRPFQAPLAIPTAVAEVARVPGALRTDIDWRGLQLEYKAKRVVVIDNLLCAAALAELQAWAWHGANFRTLRRGFVGAFPADGATHPLLLTLAEELEAAAPAIFSPHALGLWWLFKYDQTNPDGIGIHADPAAVNLNLWLTPDSAHVEGGGLEVYSRVPPLEQPVQVANTEFASREAEDELRTRLRGAGEATVVDYRCNRAVLFVSDLFHESLPFRFLPGYHNRRVNLTMLFGDRWNPVSPTEVSDKLVPSEDGAWDVF